MTSIYKKMDNNKFAYLQRKLKNEPLSDFAKFALSHKGNEFYDKSTNRKLFLWEVHETFTELEIKLIIQGGNDRYGYREKVKEEE